MRLPFGKVTQERHYPPYVTTEAERERWDLAVGIAVELFGGVGPDHVWMATRSIYRGSIPMRISGDADDE